MKGMTEAELKLSLLRYNMLSKEKATAVHMFVRSHADKTSYYDDKWEECIDEMIKMEDDLRKYGYKFVYNGIKEADGISYSAYKIVPIDFH